MVEQDKKKMYRKQMSKVHTNEYNTLLLLTLKIIIVIFVYICIYLWIFNAKSRCLVFLRSMI
jgi:hypothetical protein